jgi:hypothetical protein
MSYNVDEKAIIRIWRRLYPEMLYPNVEELRQEYLKSLLNQVLKRSLINC